MFERSLKLSLHATKRFNAFQVLEWFLLLLEVTCVICAVEEGLVSESCGKGKLFETLRGTRKKRKRTRVRSLVIMEEEKVKNGEKGRI